MYHPKRGLIFGRNKAGILRKVRKGFAKEDHWGYNV